MSSLFSLESFAGRVDATNIGPLGEGRLSNGT